MYKTKEDCRLSASARRMRPIGCLSFIVIIIILLLCQFILQVLGYFLLGLLLMSESTICGYSQPLILQELVSRNCSLLPLLLHRRPVLLHFSFPSGLVPGGWCYYWSRQQSNYQLMLAPYYLGRIVFIWPWPWHWPWPWSHIWPWSLPWS